MCVERITTLSSPISLSRFRKRTRSSGSSPAVGSSTTISFGLPSKRDGDAEALPHAAGEGADSLLAHLPQVRASEQRFDDVAPRPALDDPLQHREVIEQPLRAHSWVEAERLRQVAERLSNPVLLPDHVDDRRSGSTRRPAPAASR